MASHWLPQESSRGRHVHRSGFDVSRDFWALPSLAIASAHENPLASSLAHRVEEDDASQPLLVPCPEAAADNTGRELEEASWPRAVETRARAAAPAPLARNKYVEYFVGMDGLRVAD